MLNHIRILSRRLSWILPFILTVASSYRIIAPRRRRSPQRALDQGERVQGCHRGVRRRRTLVGRARHDAKVPGRHSREQEAASQA